MFSPRYRRLTQKKRECVPRRREGGKKNFTSEDAEGTEKMILYHAETQGRKKIEEKMSRKGAKTQKKFYLRGHGGPKKKIYFTQRRGDAKKKSKALRNALCVLGETIAHIAVKIFRINSNHL